MLYTFEMANNHMGSVAHAKLIVDDFSYLVKKYDLNACIKLQFRQLDSFIHSDFKESDLRYVKRFNETRLKKEQFEEIVQYIKTNGMKAMATPFDNESLSWLDDMDIDIIKIASCSVDDWPLLEEVAKINKKVIISTAGANFSTLRKVYSLFKRYKREFAFMHCVGEYPTPIENSNLNRIRLLQDAFPDIEIGFSTHESPAGKSVTPYAVAMGCNIIEKHVGVRTEEYSLNAYSCTVDDMERVIKEINVLQNASTPLLPYHERKSEHDSLRNLKRGVYVKRPLKKGDTILREDLYYAMPAQNNQLNASNVYDIVGMVAASNIKAHAGVFVGDIITQGEDQKILEIKNKVQNLLSEANITVTKKDKVQLSAHYGLDKFFDVGCTIIDKVNREYCKKILVMLPGQKHPTHYHIKKEEAFELLAGDCVLNLNGSDIHLTKGSPKIIFRGVKHSFSSKSGCVLEEISTTHHLNDSKYQDSNINKLSLKDRKINITL